LNWKLKATAIQSLGAVWPRSKIALSSLLNNASETPRIFSSLSLSTLSKARFVEIGAGRDLAVPIALKLLGVETFLSPGGLSIKVIDYSDLRAKWGNF
jgi:hypothetical protein